MAQNWQVNPVTRDYILAQGAPVPTDRIYEKAYFMLLIPRGRWLYGTPEQGSDLYKFTPSKRLSITEQLFASRVNDAVQSQLIATGQAKLVTTTNLESSRTGTANEIDIVPVDQPILGGAQFIPI